MIFAHTPTSTINLQQRQLWVYPSATTASSTACAVVTLASGGVLTLNPTSTITFTTHVYYQPNCLATDSYFNTSTTLLQTNEDPFYASTTVLIYVVATTTVIAWFLLTLLFLAPGRYSSNAPSRGTGWLAGRGFTSMIPNGTSVLSSGSRPWLQKAAAFLVTVALTIASANTFSVAHAQYREGRMNATDMRNDVVSSLAIRILRVISDIFIWLAQVQTLIRLFPRRKEKLIIKWFGFLLILLDTVFSCLNSFYINSRDLPRVNQDAIPALSYLFQLSISLLYGAWVFYYVATKRRYAFFTTEMPSITIISVFAIVSILIPVGMFVADVSVPAVAGWGDFFRWVGAAAASVLVWEWVERIEYLEREEKRDGILGREIFEEDEMPNAGSASKKTAEDFSRSTSEDGGMTSKAKLSRILSEAYHRVPKRSNLKFGRTQSKSRQDRSAINKRRNVDASTGGVTELLRATNLTTISQSGTPVSRTDTDTPSTVYAVHYHPVTETPPVANGTQPDQDRISQDLRRNSAPQEHTVRGSLASEQNPASSSARNAQPKWQFAQQIFKRGKRSPPLEIKQAMSLNAQVNDDPEHDSSKNFMFQRFGRLTRIGGSVSKDTNSIVPEQPTVIPAPPRGHAWSPDIMRHSPVHARGRAGEPLPEWDAEVQTRPPEGKHLSQSTEGVTDDTLVEPGALSSSSGGHISDVENSVDRPPSQTA